MALDKVVLNQGVGGSSIGVDNIGGIDYELVKQAFGDLGTLIPVSASNPLPVVVEGGVSIGAVKLLDAAGANEAAISPAGALSVDGSAHTQPISAASLPLPTGAATDSLQATGNASVSSIDTKTPALGQALSAASTPVVLPAAQITTLTPPAAITNYANETGGHLASLDTKLPAQGQALSAASLPVVLPAAQISTLTPPAAITNYANETGGHLASVDTKLPTQGQALSAASLPVVLPATQITTLTPPAAITNFANETGGHLASLDTKLPSQGQALAAASTPVVLPASQITTLTPPAAITNYANETGGNLAAIKTDVDKIPSQGQAPMAASMPVVISSNQSAIPVTLSGAATDNIQLLSSTINAAGAITGIDTTGYLSIVTQFTGTWVGAMVFEGSNDNSNWVQLLALNTDDLSMQDAISDNGVFVLKTSTKFIRINVFQLQSGSITVLMLGRSVSGINASDLLSLAFDNANGLSLNVSETQTKKDISKALIPSDAPTAIYGTANVINTVMWILDTTGYQSVTIQAYGTYTATAACFFSNDGVNFSAAVNLFTAVGGTISPSSTTITANGVYVLPVYARYLKFTLTSYTNGTFQSVTYLRQQPFIGSAPFNQNIALLNGITPITAANGVLAVGGNIANGIAPTANPNLVAGIDTSGLTRRILTDTSGRLVQAVTDAAGTVRALNGLAPASNAQNVTSLSVSDVTQFEGQSQIELLAQILLELRIVTQQLKELPLTLMGTTGTMDEPSQFRSDQSLFAV